MAPPSPLPPDPPSEPRAPAPPLPPAPPVPPLPGSPAGRAPPAPPAPPSPPSPQPSSSGGPLQNPPSPPSPPTATFSRKTTRVSRTTPPALITMAPPRAGSPAFAATGVPAAIASSPLIPLPPGPPAGPSSPSTPSAAAVPSSPRAPSRAKFSTTRSASSSVPPTVNRRVDPEPVSVTAPGPRAVAQALPGALDAWNGSRRARRGGGRDRGAGLGRHRGGCRRGRGRDRDGRRCRGKRRRTRRWGQDGDDTSATAAPCRDRAGEPCTRHVDPALQAHPALPAARLPAGDHPRAL